MKCKTCNVLICLGLILFLEVFNIISFIYNQIMKTRLAEFTDSANTLNTIEIETGFMWLALEGT